MRTVIAALAFTSLAVGTANAGFMWSGGFMSAGELQSGVACKVKRVTVLAQNAGDCRKIGGKAMVTKPVAAKQ